MFQLSGRRANVWSPESSYISADGTNTYKRPQHSPTWLGTFDIKIQIKSYIARSRLLRRKHYIMLKWQLGWDIVTLTLPRFMIK